jgi:predicted NBD/HSP70 family sugar kinase
VLFETIDAANAGDRRSVGAFRTAGRYLGEALQVLLPPLDPEQVLLTGVVARCSAYWEGVNEAWANISFDSPRKHVGLTLSAIDGHSAAIFLALREFVFSPRLDIDRLRRAARTQTKRKHVRMSAQPRAANQSREGNNRR